MLFRQGVLRDSVDAYIKKQGWTAPVNFSYRIDMPAKKASGSCSEGFSWKTTPVSDVVVGQRAVPSEGFLNELSPPPASMVDMLILSMDLSPVRVQCGR